MDAATFDERYPALLADLQRVCRSLGVGPDAEDVAQEALLLGRTHLAELRDDSKLVPWLRRIAVRSASRTRSAKSMQGGEGGLRTASRTFDLDLAVDEQRALARLSPAQRRAVGLVFFGGFGQQEAAEMLGISRGTVARTLWEARHVLARELADYATKAVGS